MSLFGFSKRPSSAPGQVQKPVLKNPPPKPGLFEGGKQVPIKQLIREARKGPIKIPGTGGQLYPRQAFTKKLIELLPYQKFKTHLNEWEAKRILRDLRKEERRNPRMWKELNRERRVLEEKWGLKGKY